MEAGCPRSVAKEDWTLCTGSEAPSLKAFCINRVSPSTGSQPALVQAKRDQYTPLPCSFQKFRPALEKTAGLDVNDGWVADRPSSALGLTVTCPNRPAPLASFLPFPPALANDRFIVSAAFPGKRLASSLRSGILSFSSSSPGNSPPSFSDRNTPTHQTKRTPLSTSCFLWGGGAVQAQREVPPWKIKRGEKGGVDWPFVSC